VRFVVAAGSGAHHGVCQHKLLLHIADELPTSLALEARKVELRPDFGGPCHCALPR
jgi:hypothetical protein